MTKAEQRALEAYPRQIEEYRTPYGDLLRADANSVVRGYYLEGYKQAEKDYMLTGKDIFTLLKLISKVERGEMSAHKHYDEVVKKFYEQKEDKK